MQGKEMFLTQLRKELNISSDENHVTLVRLIYC